MDYIPNDEYEKIKNDPINLFTAINNIDNDEAIKQFLIEISHKDNIDVCDYAVRAIENGYNAFYITILMDDIIAELKLNKESLLEYFRIINHSLKGDMISYTQYQQIQNITVKQPVFAKGFLEYLMALKEIFVFQYIVEIILSLNQINIEEKHSRLLLMANSDIVQEAVCGINGLGRIDYSNDDNHILIDKTLSCFDLLLKDEQHSVNGSIIRSLGYLYYMGDKVMQRLINLSERNDPCILMEISQFLFSKYKKINTEYFFETLLFSLTKVNSECLGIIKEIDLLLYAMVEDTDCHIDLVVDFLLKWMSDSDCKPNKIGSSQMLDMTFSGIISKTYTSQKALFTLFNNNSFFAPQLAAHVITFYRSSRDQNISFAPDSLSNLNDSDVIFICRRILGFIIQPEILCSLFYSILLGKRDNNKIVNFICSCFNEYIGYNYPKTTIDFVTGILSHDETDIPCEDILKNILKMVRQIEKERMEKTRLKELQPSRTNLYLLYRDECQSTQKYMEIAEKKSIMASLASRSYIKYGKATSYYHSNGDISEPLPFKSISYPIERTYELIVDPIGIDMDRWYFQNAQRDEK